MSDLTTIARPYAKAAFEFAVDKSAVADWSQMLEFAAQVTKNDEVHNLLNRSMSADKLAEIFIAVCNEFDEHGQNFIKVLAHNGRLEALPAIHEEFLDLRKEYDQTIDVEVTATTDLTADQLSKIGQKLEQRLERKVKLNCSIDETLLGGVIIRAGDLIIDNSVRGQIDRLSDAIMS